MYTYLQLLPILRICRTEDPAVFTDQRWRILMGKDLSDEEVLTMLRDGVFIGNEFFETGTNRGDAGAAPQVPAR